MAQRWKRKPANSNWGEFGPDDQRGRMNYVTREKVLQGAAEVKEGISFCLSLPLDYPGGSVLNPRRSPPRLASTLRNNKQNFCYPLAEENAGFTDVVCDDVVLLTLQYSTQWDSLAHVGSHFDADGDGKEEPVFYNGYRGGEDVIAGTEMQATEPWARYENPEARALSIAVLAEHGLQMGKLAQPVRVSLTGGTVSPGIYEVIAVLGRERTIRRLQSAVDRVSKT